MADRTSARSGAQVVNRSMRSCMALGAIVLTVYDLVAIPLRQQKGRDGKRFGTGFLERNKMSPGAKSFFLVVTFYSQPRISMNSHLFSEYRIDLGILILRVASRRSNVHPWPGQAASLYIAGNYGILCKERAPWMYGDTPIYPLIGLQHVPFSWSAFPVGRSATPSA